jgi:hypothetical protein
MRSYYATKDRQTEPWHHIRAIDSICEITRYAIVIAPPFRRIVIDRPADSLTLELRCGHNEIGYFDLDILYEGVVWKYLGFDPFLMREDLG